MSMEEFRLIRDLINAYCGIFFADDLKFVVHRRLAPRLAALCLETFADYHRHLRYDPGRRAEYEEIVERVTTNETYFFREAYQLDAFRDEILPEIAARPRPGGRRLTVWSAGCASGEEAYTVAILVLESGLFQPAQVHIFGNDISRRVLQLARKGIYGRASFRQTDERYLRRYFREAPGGYQVRDEVRAMVSFGQINLIDLDGVALLPEVDVIFCRNVLIYFDAESRKRAVGTFHSKLVHGGYLLLGHSESLMNLSTAFELCHLKNDLVYRKP
ncbi:MAG: protein-glutamate O-methyltransferase CheR [Deltaproteobacteria bacterium]|nr:protein-glutamate O-methyltransferase CheR [Deltaproteobacteria bacterium]